MLFRSGNDTGGHEMMELARVNDHEAAKRFFEEFNIPYGLRSKNGAAERSLKGPTSRNG